MTKQILDINNALSYFIKYYSIRNKTQIMEQFGMNHMRYYILTFHNEPLQVFFKFSRDPYFKARDGMSETININMVKMLVKQYNIGKLNYLYFATKEGYIYRIHILDFLEKAYIETEQRAEGKTKYVISYRELERYNSDEGVMDVEMQSM